jgi:hypothetical protein
MYKINHNKIISLILCDKCKRQIGFILTDHALSHTNEVHICGKCSTKYKKEDK